MDVEDFVVVGDVVVVEVLVVYVLLGVAVVFADFVSCRVFVLVWSSLNATYVFIIVCSIHKMEMQSKSTVLPYSATNSQTVHQNTLVS